MTELEEYALKAYFKALLGNSNTPKQDAWEEWQRWLTSNGLTSGSGDYDDYTEDQVWLDIVNSPKNESLIQPYFLARRLRLSLNHLGSVVQNVWGDYDRLTKELETRL